MAEVRVPDEPVTVVVSLKGWVRALKGHEVDAATLQFKPGDALYGCFACRSIDPLVVLGSNGRAYSTPVAGLPGGRGDGAPITTLIDLDPGTQPAHYFAAAPTQTLLLAGTAGFGLLARVGDLVGRQRGGKAFLALGGGREAAAAEPGRWPTRAWPGLTLAGRLLVFGIDELKLQPAAAAGSR